MLFEMGLVLGAVVLEAVSRVMVVLTGFLSALQVQEVVRRLSMGLFRVFVCDADVFQLIIDFRSRLAIKVSVVFAFEVCFLISFLIECSLVWAPGGDRTKLLARSNLDPGG